MKTEKLLQVQDETMRFLAALKAAIKKGQDNKEDIGDDWGCYNTKEAGAVRRAAHDLKRKLTSHITQVSVFKD